MSMRIALFAATAAFALLGACKGGQTNTANESSVNVSANASAPAPAGSGAVSTTPVDKATAATLMKQRHDAMGGLGKASKTIKRALDATPPDMAAIKQATPALTGATAAKLDSMFPAGTGPDVGKTGAKPEIWKNPQDFAQKASDYEAAAKQLDSAVAAGHADQVKAAFGKVQDSCKACHDKYRSEMKH